MADMADADDASSVYRTSDKIANIKINIRFGKVTSSLDTSKTDKASMKEEYEFTWQEKLLSPTEQKLYAVEENCTTELQRSYHTKVQKLQRMGGSKLHFLFSYVDKDNYEELNREKLTTAEQDSISYAGEKMMEIRQRTRNNKQDIREIDNRNHVPRFNVVIEDQMEEQKLGRHFLVNSVQKFYIMADLTSLRDQGRVRRPEGDAEDAAVEDNVIPPDPEEVVLCVLQWDHEREALTIKPDFNNRQKPYKVSSKFGRETFEYTIEHTSRPISRIERDREAKISHDFHKRKVQEINDIVGNEFEVPTTDSMQLFINGEIVSAQDFEMEKVYVQFFLDLPRDWSANSFGPLSGTTQVSSAFLDQRRNISHFSYPFEFELMYGKGPASKQADDVLPHWPILYFEVLSIDSWTRYRTEGYGYMQLPATPGCHELTAHCWRPVGTTIVSELRRFFVGGTPELEDPTFSGVPSTFDGKFLGKYGFRTESTGSITVRINSMIQSKLIQENFISKKSDGSLYDRIGGNANISVMGVINAFTKARDRMQQARENLMMRRVQDQEFERREKELDNQLAAEDGAFETARTKLVNVREAFDITLVHSKTCHLHDED